MFSYINIFKPKATKIKLDVFDYDMDLKVWDENLSVNDLLKNAKKYKDHYNRIIEADLNKPIIIDIKNDMLDGFRIYIECKLLNKKSI